MLKCFHHTVLVYALIPVLERGGRRILEFKASRVYIVRSRTAGTT